jgi:hypothetical protein
VNDEQFAAEVKRTVYRLQALCSEAVQRNVKIELSVSNIGLVKQFIPPQLDRREDRKSPMNITEKSVKSLTEPARLRLLKKLISKLDELDQEDFFGTEGWRRRLLGEN